MGQREGVVVSFTTTVKPTLELRSLLEGRGAFFNKRTFGQANFE